MPDVNEVVERLRDERNRLVTGDVDAGLRRVERLADGRRRRHRLAAGAGMLGAVAAIAALAVIIESPTPDIVVTHTTPDDTAPAHTVPESTDADSPSTSVAPTSPTTAPRTTAGTSDTVETPSMPSLGPTVAGRTATGAFIPVTDHVRTAAGDTWIDFGGTWDGGFVVGGYESTFWSSDGITWSPMTLAPLPSGLIWGERAALGDRIVAAGSTNQRGDPSPVVATTTDLETWSIQEIPVEWPDDVPDAVRLGTPPHVTADDSGWVATVQPWAHVDWVTLANERLGRSFTGAASSWADEEIRLTLDDTDTSEELTITWDELEAEWGTEVVDMVRGLRPTEIWTGSWNGSAAPVREQLPDGAADAWTSGEVIATDDGFVVVRRRNTFVDDEPRAVESIELVVGHRAPGGAFEWGILDPPFEGRLRSAFALDGDLGVLASSDDGTFAVYRVDTLTQEWSPIEIPTLPVDARSIQWNLHDVAALDVAPPEPVESTTQTIEKNGLRLTWTFDFPDSTYEVVEVATGEVIVSETIDLRDVEGSFEYAFEHLAGGLGPTVITDPATGDVLMNITAEEMEASQPPAPDPVSPELWLVASSDGVVWVSHPVPEGPDGSSSITHAALAGDRLLLQTSSEDWFVVEIR